ncbi:hypothetical protein PM082_002303 [Marasmius tenuissimus]|nr:hypothetical protein PM082_002303 [Marasmius tenuissimus]
MPSSPIPFFTPKKRTSSYISDLSEPPTPRKLFVRMTGTIQSELHLYTKIIKSLDGVFRVQDSLNKKAYRLCCRALACLRCR